MGYNECTPAQSYENKMSILVRILVSKVEKEDKYHETT